MTLRVTSVVMRIVLQLGGGGGGTPRHLAPLVLPCWVTIFLPLGFLPVPPPSPEALPISQGACATHEGCEIRLEKVSFFFSKPVSLTLLLFVNNASRHFVSQICVFHISAGLCRSPRAHGNSIPLYEMCIGTYALIPPRRRMAAATDYRAAIQFHVYPNPLD